MQINHFLLLKKLKNTSSAQLWPGTSLQVGVSRLNNALVDLSTYVDLGVIDQSLITHLRAVLYIYMYVYVYIVFALRRAEAFGVCCFEG